MVSTQRPQHAGISSMPRQCSMQDRLPCASAGGLPAQYRSPGTVPIGRQRDEIAVRTERAVGAGDAGGVDHPAVAQIEALRLVDSPGREGKPDGDRGRDDVSRDCPGEVLR